MLIYLLISFGASIVGAICGIGGGVIIKPVLDLLGREDAAVINFLSGCTVLSMSGYSVLRMLFSKDRQIDMSSCTPLAVGAAAGGILGKNLFAAMSAFFQNQAGVKAVQSFCLALITMLTLLYVLNKKRIRTHHAKHFGVKLAIGALLGVISSFLGIGGGPVNLVVLYFFFSMDTKTAASSSLYIILFSQAASLLSMAVTRSIPQFSGWTIVLMIAGGISGGVVGRGLNKKIHGHTVDKLFILLITTIICISLFNMWRALV